MKILDRISLPEPPDGVRRVEFEVKDAALADQVYLLRAREIHAINAAIAAGRPLLVRGEPGIGKSQLARAAAKELGRAYIKHVVDSRTESRDLMWTFDTVKRLADAQLAGALRENIDKARSELAVENYLHPGPLWWVFDWADAEQQRSRTGGQAPSRPDGGDWRNGCVFLLDEIDKAESEVPNGLLEALGAREFTPVGRSDPVRATSPAPLVVITTNEKRALPDAFLRRCVVINLALPKEEAEMSAFLIERGKAHFPKMAEIVLQTAASMLFRERQAAIRSQVAPPPPPGQAEYLDLLRAVRGLSGRSASDQMAMLAIVADYTLRKHVE